MTAISAEAAPAQQFVVVAFNGVSLGIMSFAFGVFDMALHYGVLPDLDVRVVSGEPAAAITGGGLRCVIPYDLDAIQAADLVIIPDWRDPAESPPEPLLGALRTAHDRGARLAGLCSGAAGLDLGLHLLREYCGAAVANRLARYMVVPPHRPGGQAQYIESPLPAPDDATTATSSGGPCTPSPAATTRPTSSPACWPTTSAPSTPGCADLMLRG
jgi:transcriptional regulator GlxA family with amidase domain